MSTYFSTPIVFLALFVAILAIFAIFAAFEARAERRLIQSLVQRPSPSSDVPFGTSLRNHLSYRAHMWTPEPGTSLDPESSPPHTWVVTCPHCGAKSEFTRRGTLFTS